MIRSIYIHIPFCNRICSYCDFAKLYYNKNYVDKYLDSLKKEIELNYKNEKIKTLYIGGGTPSSLDIEELNKLFDILKIIDKSNLIEYTIECNIEDITKEKLELFKQNKVNRISIGLQTTNKDSLKLLNRNTEIDIDEKLDLVKQYFTNINIDLMYGFNKDISILKKDLQYLISKDITHISTYSLILEENTKLYIDKFKRIDDDVDYEFYKYISDYLKQNGYIHYEISNFCKPGYESKHNLCYWNNDNYYGFGLGSGGYIDNIRYTNTRSINNYIDGKYKIYEEKLTKKEIEEYEMILGLRKVSGIDKNKFYNKFNENIEDVFDIKNMINNNLLEEKDGFIYIPYDKLYIENSILINFLGGSNE